MAFKTITLSSASLTSPSANLDWRAGLPTTASVVANSSQMTGAVLIEYSLQDLMLTPSSAVVWLPMSSAVDLSSIGSTGSLGIEITETIAALRLRSSTALSSGSAMLGVLQADRR